MASSTNRHARARHLLIVPVIVALMAGCAQTPLSETKRTLTAPSTAAATRPTTSSSAPTTAQTEQQTQSAPSEASGAMPPSALEAALVSEVVAPDLQDEARKSGLGGTGGLDLSPWGTFVSGDKACRTLFAPIQVEAASHATVSFHGELFAVLQIVESFADASSAGRLMDETEAALSPCAYFTMTVFGEQAQFEYGLIRLKGGKDGTDQMLHQLRGRGEKGTFALNVTQVQLGGEVMHVTVGGRDEDGIGSMAAEHFVKVVKTYRAEHPRG